MGGAIFVMNKPIKHIILIGFMGTGKSTVGKALAKKLRVSFVDTDQAIELFEGMSISEVFATQGEAYFRKVESKILTELLEYPDSQQVIATGGGVILSEKNRMLLEKHHVFLLQASIGEILSRVKKEQHQRPLLGKEDEIQDRITNLLNERNALYEYTADYIIQTDHKSIDTIIDEIRDHLGVLI